MKYTFEEAKEKYQKAKTHHDEYRASCKKWQEQYNTGLTGTPDNPLMVFNFTKELINSQISGNLPMPLVTPCQKSPRNIRRARVIAAMLRAEMDRLQSEELNDRAERITRMMGGCLMLTEWDSQKKTHNITGEISAQMISPLDFVPQEGVSEFDEMDYWFIVREDTKERIARRYKKDPEELSGPDADREADADTDLTTQIIMMYRNPKGGIGYITWAGDVLLLDEPDYLVRKDKVCSKCQKAQQDGEKQCECGNKKWELRDRDGEVLTQPLILADGTTLQPYEPEIGENGALVLDTPVTGFPVTDKVGNVMPAMKPRKVPCPL